ncbi:MAG: SseB family protein [Beutenbergiaceae bacterium]
MGGAQLPPTSAFADDDGSAPAHLAAALGVADPGERVEAVVRALATERVLVPVVAGLDQMQQGKDPDEIVGEKVAHAAMVTVALPDGRAALPVFSSMAALTGWRADARPVPTHGRRAALAAAGEGDGVLVLDPGGASVLVPRPAARALALGQPWLPAVRNPAVARAVERAVAGQPQVLGVALTSGEATEILIEMTLAAGLDQAQVGGIVRAVGERLSRDQVVAESVDSLTFRLRPRSSPR